MATAFAGGTSRAVPLPVLPLVTSVCPDSVDLAARWPGELDGRSVRRIGLTKLESLPARKSPTVARVGGNAASPLPPWLLFVVGFARATGECCECGDRADGDDDAPAAPLPLNRPPGVFSGVDAVGVPRSVASTGGGINGDLCG